jgi:hypothetical protein
LYSAASSLARSADSKARQVSGRQSVILHWREVTNAFTEAESILAISLDRNGDSIHRGDPINDGESMFRGEMTIACGHRNGLVAGEFLDLFDRCAGHCEPRAKRVAV